MRIEKLKIYSVHLPFSFEFSHSLRRRFSGPNVVVEVVAERGSIRGYGEGAPRTYVTGESQASVCRSVLSFAQERHFPWHLNDVSEVWDFIDGLSGEKLQNSAICALESALLDALGRYEGRYILDYFPKDFYTDIIHYGAPLPLASRENILARCKAIRDMGIRKIKLKLGKEFSQNQEILASACDVFGDDCDLKVDVNGVWNGEMALRHLPLFQKYRVRVAEQPFATDDSEFAEAADLIKACGIALMADESACALADVQKLGREGFYDMVNVRLSKCGGLRRSLKIVDYLRQNRVAFQIGCHLGESGLLSAAGRVLSLLCRDAVYHDGCYDAWLLEKNVTSEDVSFGWGGKAGPLRGPGLGVDTNPRKLQSLSESAATVTVSRP
jgi:L-alanine-DL-glutamate epimerase-like enolase superfamily enzyme